MNNWRQWRGESHRKMLLEGNHGLHQDCETAATWASSSVVTTCRKVYGEGAHAKESGSDVHVPRGQTCTDEVVSAAADREQGENMHVGRAQAQGR